MKRHLSILALCLLPSMAAAKGPACTGHFVNLMSDLCWECIYPITIGKVPVVPSRYPDTRNPSAPVSYCPKPPPVYMQIGVNIGYWEPFSLVDITRVPYCMVNMGMEMGNKNSPQIGGKVSDHKSKYTDDGFYHAHWYKYPVIYWLQIIESMACMATDAFDVAYMTELDPYWDDDELSFSLNPEAALFGDPIAQLACVPEAMKTSLGTSLPIDALFWCMGSQGSAYPLTGTSSYRDTPIQLATLLNARLNYKLHREGIVWETHGETGAICYQNPEPILPKSRYRYQMTNVIPDALRCYPYGTTTAIWESGHDNPVTGDNFGFVNFRKRNCVFI